MEANSLLKWDIKVIHVSCRFVNSPITLLLYSVRKIIRAWLRVGHGKIY